MAPKKPAATDAVPAVLADGEFVVAQPELVDGQLPVDVGGWFRNATAGDLILTDPPSVTLAPDEVVHRDRTPSHYGLEPTTEPVAQPEPTPVTDTAPQSEE